MRPHYVAGVATLRELGEQFGCTAPAILKHADKAGWVRNLTGRVKAKADKIVAEAALPVNKAVNRKAEKVAKAAESKVVDAVAGLQANVRLSHRRRIEKAAAITDGLFAELEQVGGPDKALLASLKECEIRGPTGKPMTDAGKQKIAEAAERAASLANRAAIGKSLTEALRVQIALERQAHGIEGGGDAPEGESDFVTRMLNARARAANQR